MRNFPVISLALVIASLPLAVACGSDDEPNPDNSGGSAGTTGGSAGVGGATGGAGAGGATGGAGAGGAAGGSGTMDWPADTSQAGLEAFLAALEYKGSEWLPDADIPAESGMLHGLTQIWYNKTLRTSFAAGKGAAANPHDTGSMTVKEIYTGTAVTGHAVMLRQASNWIYYCKASTAGACSSSSVADTATYSMTTGSCNCHGGGTIISQARIPPP